MKRITILAALLIVGVLSGCTRVEPPVDPPDPELPPLELLGIHIEADIPHTWAWHLLEEDQYYPATIFTFTALWRDNYPDNERSPKVLQFRWTIYRVDGRHTRPVYGQWPVTEESWLWDGIPFMGPMCGEWLPVEYIIHLTLTGTDGRLYGDIKKSIYCVPIPRVR